VWFSQPGQSKQLAGPPDSLPFYHLIRTDGYVYFLDGFGDDGFLSESTGLIEYFDEDFELRDLVFPGRADWIEREGRFRAAAREQVSGWDTVVVDWTNAAGGRELRLWVEPTTGVILRHQVFGGEDWQTLEEEIEVKALALDVDLPQELFDPRNGWKGGFALDESGEPEPPGNWEPQTAWWPAPGHELLPYTPAPPGFDPATSRLTLQIPQPPGLQWPIPNHRPTWFDLFAGPYALGRVEFGNPFGLRCDRSPDGQWLAFAPGSHWLEFRTSEPVEELRWLNLSDVENQYGRRSPSAQGDGFCLLSTAGS
jgi:hypothetical protein